MFELNKRYCFRDAEAEDSFIDQFPITNAEIAKIVTLDGFITIKEVDECGSVAFIQSDEQLVLNDDEFIYFVDVDSIKNQWKVGYWYGVNDSMGLLRADAINRVFMRECAQNIFKVIKSKDGSTCQIEWQVDGKTHSMYHAFAQSEMKYFTCFGVEPNGIGYTPVEEPGEDIETIEEPGEDIETIEEPGEDIETIEEPKPLCVIDGNITLVIGTEESRLSAIDFLNKVKFNAAV